MQAKSFLVWYKERVSARGIHLLSDKTCSKAIQSFLKEQLIVWCMRYRLQYFILELSDFSFYRDGKR